MARSQVGWSPCNDCTARLPHSTHGSKVVQRHEGIHLEAVQEFLDSDESSSFECDPESLADEPREGAARVEVDKVAERSALTAD